MLPEKDAAVYVDQQPEQSLIGLIHRKVFRPSLIQAGVVIFDQGLTSVTTFLVGILLARGCTKGEFGLYVLGNTILLFGHGFHRAIIGVPFTVLSPKYNDDSYSRYLGSSIVFQLGYCFISLTTLILVSLYFYYYTHSNLAAVFAMLSFAMFGQYLRDFIRFVLLARLNVFKCAILGSSINLIVLISLYAIYSTGKLTVVLAFGVIAAGSILPSILFLLFLYKKAKVNTAFLKGHFLKNWKLGKWIVASNIAFMFSSQIFPWLLVFFWGKEYVAELGVCQGATRILAPLTLGLSSILLPKMSRISSNTRLRMLTIKIITILSLFAIFGLIAVVFAGEWFVSAIYSNKYSGLKILIIMCFCNYLIGMLSMPINSALYSIKRTDVAFKSLVISSVIALSLGLFLTWEMAAIGVCIGMFISSVAATSYKLAVLFKMLRLK